MSVIKHTHIYVFLEKLKGVEYYKCDDPHCTHFEKRSKIINKASMCTECRKREIILDWKTLRRRRPKCLHCSNTKEGKAFRSTQEIMSKILQGGEKK